jgi:hypothetical protein
VASAGDAVGNLKVSGREGYENSRPNDDRCESDLRDETGQSNFDENFPTDLQIFGHLTEMKNKIGRRNAFRKSMLEPLSFRILDGLMAEGHSELVTDP